MSLKGKTVLTTRAASQSGELCQKLEAVGARVIEYPTIEITPVDDWSIVDAAIQKLDTYQWLLFTSGNAVDYFMKRVERAGRTVVVPIAVVGAATARRLETWKLRPAIVPNAFHAEGLLEAMPQNLAGSSILFPRAEVARELLPTELRRRGAQVDVITVYRTGRSNPSRSFAEIVSSETIDCIVFTSPSTIHYLAESVEGSLSDLLKGASVAVIGPVTQEAAVSLGLTPSIMPPESTIDSLVEALNGLM